MTHNISQHAQTRLQQRGVPFFVLELLDRFGSTMRCGGAERVFFDKAALKRLRKYLGGDRGLKAIESWLKVYVVVGDNGVLVTIGHRTTRFSRL